MSFPDGIEKAKGTKSINLSSIVGDFKRNFYMTLGGEIVDFIWLNFFEKSIKVASVGYITMVKKEPTLFLIAVDDMINSSGVERTTATDDAVDFVPFLK